MFNFDICKLPLLTPSLQEEVKRLQTSLTTDPVYCEHNVNPVDIFRDEFLCINNEESYRGKPKDIHGFWKDGKYYVKRIKLRTRQGRRELTSSEEYITLSEPLARNKCQFYGGNTRRGCRNWSRIVNIEGKWQSMGHCWRHRHFDGSQALVLTLGRNNIYARVFPRDLQDKLVTLLNSEESKSVLGEIGVLKLLLENFLSKQAKTINEDGTTGLSDHTTLGVFAKISSLIGVLAKTQSEIEKQRENMLDIKHILILLDALVNWLLKKFGRSDDPRNLLLEALPELPWPQGVARVNGAEGLIGQRGMLLLPNPQADEPGEVNVDWARLKTTYGQDEVVEEPPSIARFIPTPGEHFIPLPDSALTQNQKEV